MDSYQKQDSFLAFIFKTSQTVTTDLVYGNQFKPESFLNKHLMMNPSVETYKRFLAKCYNEWQILNTVAFLYYHKYQQICLVFGKIRGIILYIFNCNLLKLISFVFSYTVNL